MKKPCSGSGPAGHQCKRLSGLAAALVRISTDGAGLSPA